MNIKKYKDDGIFKKITEYLESHILKQEDQELINVVCFSGIELLPPKYGIHFLKRREIYILSNKNYKKRFYDKKELIDANDNAVIRHYWNEKPWIKGRSSRLYRDFIHYAKNSNFFDYICKNLEKIC